MLTNPLLAIEGLDDRQMKEVSFCLLYARDYAHGTDGHNAKIIIAKLAELVVIAQSENDRLRFMIQKAIDAPHETGCGSFDMSPCDCGRAVLVTAILRKALE